MLVVTLIATIIHMNMGFPLLEAIGRGFVSALMVGALGVLGWGIFAIICWLFGKD